MKKKVIWYLFDSAGGSGKSAYEKWNHKSEYIWYSIGLNDNAITEEEKSANHFIECDLSKNNETLLKLCKYIIEGKLQKPDIILASPPCESWSTADTPAQPYWLKDKLFIPKTKEEFNIQMKSINRSRSFDKKTKQWEIGIGCITTTYDIIKFFGVDIYFIENGANTYIWQYITRYLDPKLKQNKTHYSAYGWDTKKPTKFSGNHILNLKTTKEKSPSQWCFGTKKLNTYNARSNIPNELLLDIYNQIHIIMNLK